MRQYGGLSSLQLGLLFLFFAVLMCHYGVINVFAFIFADVLSPVSVIGQG